MKPPDPASVGAYPGANDASSRDYSKWDDAISVERVRQLRDEGWCVVDDFLGGGGASSSSSDATSRGADGADVASGERWATAIRDEIKWLSGTGLMRPNRTHFANPKGERHLFAKPNVYETDLHEEEIRVLCPELDALFRESATRLANAFTARIDELSAMEYREANEQQEAMDKHKAELFSPSRARVFGSEGNLQILDCHEHHPDHPDHPVRRHSELTREVGDYEHISEPRAPSEANSEDEDESPSPPGGASVKAPAPPKRRPFDLYTGDRSRTVKIQHNAGRGGCFPLHYDNPGPPSSRALTCILYLNPDWSEGDGGELQLIPFLRAPVRVNPRHGRLVVFLSDRVLHKVLPSEVERFCLTIWLDGSVNSPRDTRLNLPPTALKDIKKTADALHGSASQRALSRAVYPDEYEKSLLDCMGGVDGCAEMLESHAAHLRALSGNKPLKMLVDALRKRKAETADAEPEMVVE